MLISTIIVLTCPIILLTSTIKVLTKSGDAQEVIELLLKFGARKNALNEHGQNALHMVSAPSTRNPNP